MFNTVFHTEKGASLIESLVAILLLSAGLIAVMSMLPTSYKTSARSDYLGRGIMVLNKEITAQEAWIANPCNTVTVGNVAKTVYTSYQTTQQAGDTSFNVLTVTTAVANVTNSWLVTITVSWPPVNTKGITDSIIVTRQETFRYGCT